MKLTRFRIKQDICRICGKCEQACEENAIITNANKTVEIDYKRCNRCGRCLEACKLRAITKEVGLFI